ncbi:hypothetical protein NE237_032791 [Protea cynaroides]|uniref:Uncharacterized protein n=1 Tax=Protea cynaroides TaxID=273540 RepID=A0A9Q0L4Y4_9MAGN|nr:hypothetical protein NE237_032791 [Protea cynaroides]
MIFALTVAAGSSFGLLSTITPRVSQSMSRKRIPDDIDANVTREYALPLLPSRQSLDFSGFVDKSRMWIRSMDCWHGGLLVSAQTRGEVLPLKEVCVVLPLAMLVSTPYNGCLRVSPQMIGYVVEIDKRAGLLGHQLKHTIEAWEDALKEQEAKVLKVKARAAKVQSLKEALAKEQGVQSNEVRLRTKAKGREATALKRQSKLESMRNPCCSFVDCGPIQDLEQREADEMDEADEQAVSDIKSDEFINEVGIVGNQELSINSPTYTTIRVVIAQFTAPVVEQECSPLRDDKLRQNYVLEMESILARALEYSVKYWLKSFSREQFKLHGRTVQLSNLDINGDALHARVRLPPTLNVMTTKVWKLQIKDQKISFNFLVREDSGDDTHRQDPRLAMGGCARELVIGPCNSSIFLRTKKANVREMLC